MRLTIILTFFVLTLSCTNRPMELSEKCKQLIESNSFYYVAPLPGMKEEFDAMWKLDNFLTISNELDIQTIDFDCVVAVNPTPEKLEELRKLEEEHFDETVRISTMHVEATRCVTESRGIGFVQATGQLIRFKTTNQTWDLDMQKDKFQDWKFILFKKGKEPKIIPNIQAVFVEIDIYFGTEASR